MNTRQLCRVGLTRAEHRLAIVSTLAFSILANCVSPFALDAQPTSAGNSRQRVWLEMQVKAGKAWQLRAPTGELALTTGVSISSQVGVVIGIATRRPIDVIEKITDRTNTGSLALSYAPFTSRFAIRSGIGILRRTAQGGFSARGTTADVGFSLHFAPQRRLSPMLMADYRHGLGGSYRYSGVGVRPEVGSYRDNSLHMGVGLKLR